MDPLVPVFRALGDENRLKIIQMLLSSRLCVGALAHRLGISSAAVSQHLQTLSRVGLVKGHRCGPWVHYTVDRSALRELAQGLIEISQRPSHPVSPCPMGLASAGGISRQGRTGKRCMDCFQMPDKLKDKARKDL